MRASVIVKGGKLEEQDAPAPEVSPGYVRVRVRAAGVNRADLLQRAGLYPAPADAPASIPGLEFAGEIDAAPRASRWREGDRVYGITGGGAYAEYIVAHERAVAPIPERFGFIEAAAVPEAFVTAYDALVAQAGLASGESVLVHACGSGVGTAAVQVARAASATVIGTARTDAKLARAEELGLATGILTARAGAPSFAGAVKEATSGRGVDVVIDLVGGAYVGEDLLAIAPRGRIVVVGLLAGPRCDVDLGLLLRSRARVIGTVLRSRPLEEKILATQALERNLGPLFARGVLRPTVDRVFSLARAADAHEYVATNEGFGKVILTLDEPQHIGKDAVRRST